MYNVVLVFSVIVAVLLTLLILITAKGDAMSGGGGSVRTSYKGKASFDDQIGRVTLIGGGLYMALMLILDIINNRMVR